MATAFDERAAREGYGQGPKTAGPSSFAGAFDARAAEQGTAFDQRAAAEGYSGTVDMVGTYRQWYTGASQEGVDNAWDTDFVRAHVEQGDEALADGNMWDRYAREDATGVVLWNGAKDSQGNSLRWGDVMSNGQKVGNVYDDMDRHTANVMMGQFTIQDGAEKAKLNANRDYERAWEDRISQLEKEFTEQAELAPRAKELQEDIAEGAEEEQDERLWAQIAAGSGAGAVLGAGIGSVVPVIGTAVGTVAGTVIGGFGAWLNQDANSYAIARTREIAELAKEQGGRDAEISQVVQGVAQTAMGYISPLGNLYKGGYDVATGLYRDDKELFDASSGGNFYLTDDEGNRLVPGWAQVGEYVAMVGDSLLQFASPAGLMAYQAQMSLHIAGKTAGLLPGVGQFDQSRLEMDSVWTNDKGEFDLGNALAGIGSVGIDVVQLGAASGLLRSTNQFTQQVLDRTGLRATGAGGTNRWWGGRTKAQGEAGEKLAQGFGSTTRLSRWLETTGVRAKVLGRDVGVGLSKAQRDAVKAGGTVEVRSGYKFVFDKEGNLVDRGRATLTMLAPSEGLQSMGAAMMARRATARKEGAVQAEELYRVANDMSLGARPIQMMLVNAFGEGTEEVLQTVLDPLSHNAAIDGEEIVRAGAGGFASGLGMGGAVALRRANPDSAMFAQAGLAHYLSTGGDKLTKRQWDQMSAIQKRKMARAFTDMDRTLISGAVEKIQRDLVDEVNGGVVAAQFAKDEQAKQIAAALETGTAATDATHTIVQLDEASTRSDAVASSHTQMLIDQRNRTKGIRAQISNANAELKEIKAKLKDNPTDTTLTERQTLLTDQVKQLDDIAQHSDTVTTLIEYYAGRIDAAIDAGSRPQMEAEVDELNQRLKEYFEMPGTQVQVTDLSGRTTLVDLQPQSRFNLMRAVSRIVTRHPQDSTGSIHVFIPQVDYTFANRRTRGAIAVSQISLVAIRGDYDGDKMQELNQLLLSDEDYISMRAGANLLGTSFTPEIGTTKAEEWILDEIRRARVSESDNIRADVDALKTNLANDLRARYQTPGNPALGIPARNWIPQQKLDAVIDRVVEAIDAGGDVRNTLLTEMSRHAGVELQKLGRTGFGDTRFSNEYFALARLATKHLQQFQRSYAMKVPRNSTDPSTSVAAPSQWTSQVQEQRALTAASMAAQMTMQLPGDNLFRMFQKLHYTLFYSTELGVGFSGDNPQFEELVKLYEQISSSTLDLKVDLMPANDEITGAVLDQLTLLAHDPKSLKRLGLPETATTNHAALLANMEVAHWEYQENDQGQMVPYSTGRTVTLAQQLLYMELEKYKARKVATWGTDPDVQAPYWALKPMTEPSRQGVRGGTGNSERAFVEVFNAVRLYDVLGPDAASMLNANMTVGQYFRRLKNMRPDERGDEKNALYVVGEYLRSEDVQIPYPHKQVEDKKVTLFRSVVDSLFSAASSELSIQRTGKDAGSVTGRMAQRDEDYSEDFKAAFQAVRKVLQAWRPAYQWSEQDVMDLVEENPSYGRVLLEAIPDHLRMMVLKGESDTGGYKLASWFFKVFTHDSVDAAEMEFLRQIVMQGWRGKLHTLGLDDDTGDNDSDKRMAYHSLTHRFHRVMFRLASQSNGVTELDPELDTIDVNTLPYQMFIQQLMSAKSAKEFVKWMNKHPEITGDTAPFLVWINDTAEFDEDKTGSGWSKTMTMPMVRENLKALTQASDKFVRELQIDNDRASDDLLFAESVERWENRAAGETREGDEENWKNLEAVLDNASKYQMTYGPRAMITQVMVATFGMYGQAHTKGTNPEFLAAIEAAEALLNAFGYTINAERLLGDLTSHSESAVAATPELLMKDAARYVDKFGSTVEWQRPTVASILPFLKEKKHRHLMRSMLFPQVMELDADGKARRKMLLGGKMRDLVQSTTYNELYTDEASSVELAKAMKWLSIVEGQVTEETNGQESFSVQSRVAELLISRHSARTRPLTFDEHWGETITAYMDVYREMQAVSLTTKNADGSDPVHRAYQAVKKNQRVQAIAEAYGLSDDETITSLNDVKGIVEAALINEYRGPITALDMAITEPMPSWADPAGHAAYLRDLERQRDSLRTEWNEKRDRLNALASADVPADLVARYGYSKDWSSVTGFGRQQVLLDYVKRHMNLSRSYPEAQPVITEILNWFKNGPTDRVAHPFETSPENWEMLSSIIISYELYDLLETGSADNAPPAYPVELTAEEKAKHKLDKRKYFDHGFVSLIDYMSPDTTSALLPVLRKVAKRAGQPLGRYGEEGIADVITSTTMKSGTLGAWSGSIPIHSIEANDLLRGASAKPAVSQAGKLSERWSAPMNATRRDKTHRVADAQATLTWNQLKPGADRYAEVDVTIRGVKRKRHVQQLNKRFVSGIKVQFADGMTMVPIDVFGDEFATRTWVGEYSDAAAQGSGLLEVRLDILSEVIEKKIREHFGPSVTKDQLTTALATVTVDMDLVHPEGQVTGEKFNNLWREGTNFDSDGDTLRSLLEGLIFGVGGWNPTVQQNALDTRKKGLLGIERYIRPSHQSVRDAEMDTWTDLGKVLAEKTKIFMQTAIAGGKSLDPSYYNGVHKLMKLSHWVEGTDRTTNERVRWPAERVIEWQLNNPGADIRDDAAGFPLRDTTLWIPSADVLSTMLGEIGYGGVRGRAGQTEVKTDPRQIPTYEGWSDHMQKWFAPSKSQPKSVEHTDVANQTYMSNVRVSLKPTLAQRDEYSRRRDRVRRVRSEIMRDRTIDAEQSQVNWKKSVRNVKQAARQAVKTMDVQLALPQHLGWAQARAGRIGATLSKTIGSYIGHQREQWGNNVGAWYYQHNAQGGQKVSATEGFLDKASIDNLPLAPGDLFVVDVAGFDGPEDEMAEAADALMQKLADLQVSVVFVSSSSKNRLTAELHRTLTARYRYQSYDDNPMVLVPDTLQERLFQNEAASQSHLTSFGGVTVNRQRITMLADFEETEENTIRVPDGPSRFDTMQALVDLLPTDAAAKFGVPKTREDLEKVRQTLEGMKSVTRQNMLIERAQDHLYENVVVTDKKTGRRSIKRQLKKGTTNEQLLEVSDSWVQAWDNLMARIDKAIQNDTTLPVQGDMFGTGDIVPLLGPNNELLLYRHGHEMPSQQEMRRQLAGEYEGQSEFKKVAVYSGTKLPNATTHRGRVLESINSQNYGLKLVMEIEANQLGQKFQFEYNGMKYIRGALPAGMKLPNVPAIGNQRLDGVASLHDSLSKQAFKGLGNHFGAWFTMVGWDAMPYLERFFSGLSRSQIIDMLENVQNDMGSTLQVDEIKEIQGLLTGQGSSVNLLTSMLPHFKRAGVLDRWSNMLVNDTAEAYVTRSLLMYLMSPGANLQAALGSSGFFVNSSSPDAKAQVMPELFTRMFDLAPMGSVIRKDLEKHINDRIGNKTVNGRRTGWELDADTWEVIGRDDNGKVVIRGMWQFGEAHVDDSNPELNAQAQDRKTKQGVSVHAQLVGAAISGGVTLPQRKKLKKIEDTLVSGVKVPTGVGELWSELTRVNPATMGAGAAWQMQNAAEIIYEDVSLEHQHAFRRRIKMEGELWSDDRGQRAKQGIDDAINDIIQVMGLDASQSDVIHFWIRQVLWAPSARKGQKGYNDQLDPEDVLGATQHILKNVRQGFVPTKDGAGPGMLSQADLAMLFRAAQRNRANSLQYWAPRAITDDPKSELTPDDYSQWIATTWGQVLNSDAEFDPAITLDFDGFLNTYRSVLRDTGYLLDTTVDKELQTKLVDPRTNELITTTISPTERVKQLETVILPGAQLSLADLEYGVGTAENTATYQQPASWENHRQKARARWRAKNRMQPVKADTIHNYMEEGANLLNRNADLNSLERILMALRHGNAMLNPGLYVTMLPEQAFRGLLGQTTSLVTGAATSRVWGGGAARLALGEVDEITGRKKYSLSQYSTDQIKGLNALYRQLGDDKGFSSLIIKELMYQPGGAKEGGRIVRAFEKFASVGNRWQDPTWGTPQRTLARRYVEGILRGIQTMPLANAMTTDAVIAYLRTDPAYFANHHKELHEMASNHVVDYRAMKNTVFSLAIKKMYEPLVYSSSGGLRFVGTLIKLPLMYANFSANTLVTMAGLQGFNQALAVVMEGRKKPGVIRAMEAAIKGEPLSKDEEYFDMKQAMDGVDLANAFIKGGITHSGLFFMGMLGSSLFSLAGEDEEARRRRKLAQAQNVPPVVDPRRLEADFRNKDTVFVEWMPEPLKAFFRVTGEESGQDPRSMTQFSWILKPFLNPIIGMERFFQTGDFGWVTHAFQDALVSMPLFNLNTWDDAVRSAEELQELAAQAEMDGGETATKDSFWFLMNAFGVYERMLVENMWVNSLYTGYDEYERDSARLPLRDSDGDIQRTVENLPREQNIGLKSYVDDEGNVQQAYLRRSDKQAFAASIAKKQLTAAAFLSLVTGNSEAYWRRSQPVKTVDIKAPDLTREEAGALVAAGLAAAHKEQSYVGKQLSLPEITSMLGSYYAQNKMWDQYNNVDAIAKSYYEDPSKNPDWDPMYFLANDGETELPARSAVIAAIDGLRGGTVTLDSPVIQQLGLTREMRDELEKEFIADEMQRGVDMGLTNSQANKRVQRLLFGPLDNPQVIGFRTVLRDNRIPTSGSQTYKQLNTTYAIGPDGYPWATGFQRGNRFFSSLIGGPLKRPNVPESVDIALNTQNYAARQNTGLRGLVPMDESELIPTDLEQTQMIIDALRDLDLTPNSFTPFENNKKGGRGYFYRRPYSRGRSRGGYGGGGGYSPKIYWSRNPSFPRGTNIYMNGPRALFWDNASVRRATIRRERISSQRGRLNQWQ